MPSRTDHSVLADERLSCDLVLWELSSGLLDGIRDRLQGVQRIEGKHLVSERGNWHGRKVLIASSISKESFTTAYETLALTHHPQQIIVIGEGTCLPEACPELPLVCGSEIINSAGNQLPIEITHSQQAISKDLPLGIVTEGPIRVDEVLPNTMVVSTNWLLEVHETVQQSGLEAILLVAVQPQPLSEGMLCPPTKASNPKLTRQLGRLWGQLWSQPKQITGTLKEPVEHWRKQLQIADQIEMIVKQLE